MSNLKQYVSFEYLGHLGTICRPQTIKHNFPIFRTRYTLFLTFNKFINGNISPLCSIEHQVHNVYIGPQGTLGILGTLYKRWTIKNTMSMMKTLDILVSLANIRPLYIVFHIWTTRYSFDTTDQYVPAAKLGQQCTLWITTTTRYYLATLPTQHPFNTLNYQLPLGLLGPLHITCQSRTVSNLLSTFVHQVQ